jgi:diguanylate cyclase (GGDEF)-like protein/PAS domain S-box-containing protein
LKERNVLSAASWGRLLISASSVGGYVVAIPLGYELLGAAYFHLVALPVAAVAGCWGRRIGLLAAAVGIATQIAMAVALEAQPVLSAENVAHTLLIVAMAYGFGTMYDLIRRSRAESERAERSEGRLKMLVANAPLIFWSVDASGRFIAREGRSLEKLGYRSDDHIGEDARGFYRREYPNNPELVDCLERALRGEAFTTILRLRGLVFEVAYVPLRGMTGEIAGVVGVTVDVTERVTAESKLRRSEARLDEIVRSAQDAIITVDDKGKILIFNEAAEKMFGRTALEMLGGSLEPLIPSALREQHRQRSGTFIESGTDGHAMHGLDLSGVRSTGEEFPIQATLSRAIVDGEALATVIVRDVTEQRRFEAELTHRALYDALTDLPNRALFDDRVDSALAHLRRDGQPGAVLVVDVDHFQETNETLGHDVGDDVLKAIGARLRGELREPNTLARLGGDKFAVFLSGSDERGACEVAERLLDALERPLDIRGQRIDQSISIGIAAFPSHGDDRSTLVRRAEIAMKHAKRARRTYSVYAAEDDHSNSDGIALLADLRAAIDAGEINLAFQPDVAMASGEVLRVEALARWTHATRGPISPDRFIPLAERSGLIGALTRCVLEKAIAQAAEWRRAGIDLQVAVNLSVHDLLDRELPFTISDLLRRYSVPSRFLSVELTESLLMSEVDRAVPTLSTLRSLGVQVAIDDFGTGYSSLKYLAHLPVDRIKIDRSFISGMAGDRGIAAVVRAAVNLAHDLRLEVVAEGVEEPSQWAQLLSEGADSVQGYFISRPLPAAEIPSWLAAYVPPVSAALTLGEAGLSHHRAQPEVQGVEQGDVLVRPARRLEGQHVPDAARHVHHSRRVRAPEERGIAHGEDAVVGAPQHQGRDVA